ncbi:MAG: carbohydrate ABC transporter permease [Clostridia bacterium]|nr:carbohydrate ABC transporter permease [Clostridia bacterium]
MAKKADAYDHVITKNRFNSLSPGWNFAFAVILIFVSLFALIPMALVFIVSFTSEASISYNGFSFWPSQWALDGYGYLGKMGNQVVNSYIVTIAHSVFGTLCCLAVMSMYAYVIAQRNFPARRFFIWILFFTMLFGGGLVPSYMLNVNVYHLRDTFWIFIVPSLVSAYHVIILRTFIISTIPDTLFEAGKIDGAGHFRIFIQIVLPLFKAGIATIGLFQLVGRWNDWFTAYLYIDNSKLVPLQTLLQKIQNDIDFLKNNAEIAGTPEGVQLLRQLPNQNLRMACTVIVVLPILCAYPFFQRYFVSGLTIGSVKE